MTTTIENQTAKPKQVPDFYIFENAGYGEKGGKPAGAAFVHKKGKGFIILIGAQPELPQQPYLPCDRHHRVSEEQGHA